jgi:hypothetical protein
VSGEARDAAVLLGASEALMDSVGVAFGPAEQRLREIVLSELRESQSSEQNEELLRSGRGVEVEDAITLARSFLE